MTSVSAVCHESGIGPYETKVNVNNLEEKISRPPMRLHLQPRGSVATIVSMCHTCFSMLVEHRAVVGKGFILLMES